MITGYLLWSVYDMAEPVVVGNCVWEKYAGNTGRRGWYVPD
ncbi:hypothetical protein BRYFOR_07145 [Marvinbryantia formatexigens DSM 14469]|uniref:Uncharacterized protein n=1 Tax=Marvinbryantia formatexigens DSM 14469 TaxID=478749 RepID=C6LEU4_9FIRM|nr:hypothetical protein BRYFOR_07145 [Marvinbryantia formatexigens DSM 14469]